MTYEWNFRDLVCHKSVDGQVDVVSTVSWTLTATDGGFSASDNSTVGLSYKAGDPFTAFA